MPELVEQEQDSIRCKMIDAVIRVSTFVLLVAVIWYYPNMFSLDAVRGFILGLIWSAVLSSFKRERPRVVVSCMCVGMVGAFSDSTFDVIKILLIGLVAACLTYSEMLSATRNAGRVKGFVICLPLRFTRSVAALLGGILFLFLPFPRSQSEIGAGGDITEKFPSFLFFVIFMIAPVLVLDSLVERFARRRGVR